MFLVDAGAVAETPEGVMHERQQLSEEGMFIVVARVNAQTGEPLGPPDVISRGVVSPQGANGPRRRVRRGREAHPATHR